MADKQQADTYKTDYGQVKSCNSHNRDNVKDAKSIERMSKRMPSSLTQAELRYLDTCLMSCVLWLLLLCSLAFRDCN